jgi:hypothetical protein
VTQRLSNSVVLCSVKVCNIFICRVRRTEELGGGKVGVLLK